MIDLSVAQRLLRAFPKSVINHYLQFVADCDPRVDSCFRLENCASEEDVKAKVLEWLSRDSCKSAHYNTNKRNEEVHEYHRQGINAFLGTSFTPEDMAIIYQRLGNAVHRQKTLEFIRSGYDMEVLKND